MNDTVNFCYASDNSYIAPTTVSITSLLENNTAKNINVHILYSDISEENRMRVSCLENRYKHAKIIFHKIDAEAFDKCNISISHISKETYYRYLIANLLSDIDKILYLDGDTIVDGDILHLFDEDLDGFLCAGVKDEFIEKIGYAKTIGINSLYINAGVILFNLREMRKDESAKKLFELTEKNNFRFQDQDAINIVFAGKIKKLDIRYNFKRSHQKRFPEKAKDALIIHYTSANKPWKKKSSNSLKKLYYKYREISPFRNEKLKVAVLVDEYFGQWRTAFGGFGFLAKEVIGKYLPSKDIQVDVILGRQKNNPFFASKRVIDNIDVYRLPRNDYLFQRWINKSDYDCFLGIEVCYDMVLKWDKKPHRKFVLWIQDPRPQWAWDKISQMQIVKEHNYYNEAAYKKVGEWNKKGKCKFITQGRTLVPLAYEVYGVPQDTESTFVPNPISFDQSSEFDISKKKKQVVFLGRLESQKRAWLFCEVAKLMPEYEFFVVGKFHRKMEENKAALSEYTDSKVKNLHFIGHLESEKKDAILKESRVLLNTSIWEGIPISWLEALAYGCTLVSCFEREELVERFGTYCGEIEGDGFKDVERFINPIRELMENDSFYAQKAQDAIAYIRETHTVDAFKKNMRTYLLQNYY